MRALLASGLVNLSDRTGQRNARGQRPARQTSSPTVLVVDRRLPTSQLPNWQNLGATPLAKQRQITGLWRVERARLDQRKPSVCKLGKARSAGGIPAPTLAEAAVTGDEQKLHAPSGPGSPAWRGPAAARTSGDTVNVRTAAGVNGRRPVIASASGPGVGTRREKCC